MRKGGWISAIHWQGVEGEGGMIGWGKWIEIAQLMECIIPLARGKLIYANCVLLHVVDCKIIFLYNFFGIIRIKE